MRWLIKLVALVVIFNVVAVQAQTTAPSVKLTWTISATATATYQVYRETSLGACTLTSTGAGPGCLLLNSTPIANPAAGTTLDYVDTGVAFNTTVFYIVKASATGFTSAFTNEAKAVIPPAALLPGKLTCQVKIDTNGTVGGTCQ